MEDDGGGYLVDEGFVLPRLASYAAVYHRLKRHFAGEALVDEFDLFVGVYLAQVVDKWCDLFRHSGRVVSQRGGEADDYRLYIFALEIFGEILFEFGRRYCVESAGYEL